MELAGWPWQSMILFSAIFFVFLLVTGRRRGKRAIHTELPPGPPALLFLAKFLALRRCIFDLPQLLRELHARHGPVISLRLHRPLIFISDRHLAHRALVQCGATFTDRPQPFEPGLLFTSGGRNINAAPYGPYWRLVRRNLATKVLHPARLSLFAPARRWTRDALVGNLLASSRPVKVRPLLRRAMFELFVYMCFGARLGREALDEIEELQLWIVRTFLSYPIFYLLPSLTKRLFHKRWAAHMAVRRRLDKIFLRLIHVGPERGRGDDPRASCYADSLLALRVPDEGGRPLTDGELVSLCLEFVSAGNDGMATMLEWIMAELVNNPDMQARVYKEVRSKPEGDLQQQATPYLNAVVLEALRLHPPLPFLVPHGVHSDGAEIGGHKVPKGAEVNVLVAEIGRDETVWTAAREFRPERFLDGGEGYDVDITGRKEIKMMPFGVGPRMCPGYTLGILHVAYLVSGIVREMELLPPADGQQVDMTETLDFTTLMKYPLHARTIPRS